jgi:hypothetical protein
MRRVRALTPILMGARHEAGAELVMSATEAARLAAVLAVEDLGPAPAPEGSVAPEARGPRDAASGGDQVPPPAGAASVTEAVPGSALVTDAGGQAAAGTDAQGDGAARGAAPAGQPAAAARKAGGAAGASTRRKPRAG